jgi:broad specificity phosphatase PhoE
MPQTRNGGGFFNWGSKEKPSGPVVPPEEIFYDAKDGTPVNTRYAVIVSHNSRIQCLLAKIAPPNERIRFQNCSVLKIYISKGYIEVDLLHSGEITETDQKKEDKVYYCDKYDKRLFYQPNKFKQFIPMKSDAAGLKRLGINVPLVNDYIFYLVRHGQSEHNQGRNLHIKLDTSLLGSDKSVRFAAAAISRDIGDLKRVDMFFVSDLIRTRQTLNIMKSAWGWYDYTSYLKEHLKNKPVRSIVLPCASEVAGVGNNGDCDSSIWVTQKMSRENYPGCTLSTISDPKNDCSKFDWSIYLQFYSKKMRGQEDTFTGLLSRKTPRMRCRDTTLLAMAIYCLDFRQYPLPKFIGKQPSGGTRRKRKRLHIFPRRQDMYVRFASTSDSS